MDIENIVAVLRNEFDRIGHAIGLLENNTPTKARRRTSAGFRLPKIRDRSVEVVSLQPVAASYRWR